MSGSFSSLQLPTLGGGLSWDTSQLTANGVIGVVPEPGTATLALLGAGMFSLRRPR